MYKNRLYPGIVDWIAWFIILQSYWKLAYFALTNGQEG